ncbi:hypothetical protein CVT26_015907 [Gymnopilus dilepis]|uniref:Uncharacterized protein n=1 Tax=Gymnopilus dilepis TaxID=231916 RepID=A0A409WAF5_9AGAR|nr:hypothetical protein CVT26_015907 [Gymnopilus dilepis]
MAEVQLYPPGYHQYVATQRRVSDWVKHTHSLASSAARKTRRPGSRHSTSSAGIASSIDSDLLPWKRPKSSRRRSSPRRMRSMAIIEPPPVTPAVALVSSSLFVCALLPSILTISAFVVLLTIASMDQSSKRDHKDNDSSALKLVEEW